MEDRESKGDGASDVPRYHPSFVHLANGPFEVTITWLEHDPTVLPDDQHGPHEPSVHAIAQTVLSYGAAKSMIPMLVKSIAEYETTFGEIPSPGFDDIAKG